MPIITGEIRIRAFFIRVFIIIIAILVTAGYACAGYREFLQQGTTAYKAKNWIEAARNYKLAYLEQPGSQLKKFMDAAVKNAYREGMAKGNAAYKAGDMEEALKWYSQAQEVSPSRKLEAFISKISAKVGPQDAAFLGTPGPAGDESPLKWVLLGGDAVLAVASVFLYMDASGAADDYNALHEEINDTTMENYNLLLSEKEKVEGKQALFGAAAALTAAAVGYTLADMFAIHAVFPAEVRSTYNFMENRLEVAVNLEF